MQYAVAQAALANLETGIFVGLDTETQVKLKGGKKNPQQGRITKRMTGASVMCFANVNSNAYENIVKRRLMNEGKNADDFVLGERAWGQRIAGTPFVEHNGKQYLEVIFLHAGTTEYFMDGLPIAKANIVGLEEAAPSEGSQGGLEQKVVLRTFAVENIVELRVNGKNWK